MSSSSCSSMQFVHGSHGNVSEVLTCLLCNFYVSHFSVLDLISIRDMPTATIDYTGVLQRLQDDDWKKQVITTPFGLSLLEIQGDLNLPESVPPPDTPNKEYLSQFVKIDEVYDAVKCGSLEFSETDKSDVTLYIANSQRLLGKIVPLQPPLGILKVPLGGNEPHMDMVDIITHKMVFNQRPLPIM